MDKDSVAIDLFCPSCNVQVEARIVAQHQRTQVTQMAPDPVDSHYRTSEFTLAACIRCQGPFLVQEDFYEVPGDFTLPMTEKLVLYPQDSSISLSLDSLPESVFQPYCEASQAYQVQLYDSCAVMCRKCVEAVCLEYGETKGVLVERLTRLMNKGVIDKAIFDWANELRLAGNVAAHMEPTNKITQLDAKDALEFVRMMLLYIFELHARFQTFRGRRAKKKN